MSYISYNQIDILEQLPILIGPDFDWYIFLFLSPIAFSRHLGWVYRSNLYSSQEKTSCDRKGKDKFL